MAFVGTSSKPNNTKYSKGNPFCSILLSMAAAFGGWLFGYDTAVANGVEKALSGSYISDSENILDVMVLYSVLLVIVLFAVIIIFSGEIIKLLNKRHGIIISAFILSIITDWAYSFPEKARRMISVMGISLLLNS